MWHAFSALIAADFHVIAPDLRGYGDSAKPASSADHEPYSKRVMACDVVDLMTHLGYPRFSVLGHDRGARVAHRMCLDFPERLACAGVLDIVPTRLVFERCDRLLATAYYHWFFLQQPTPFPEQMIAANPELFLRQCLCSWSAGNMAAFAPEALSEYLRCFSDPETIHATSEDYRAAATIDFAQDSADCALRISCPLLVLWGSRGFIARHYEVLALWRDCAKDAVRGRALDCGHFIAEEKPSDLAQEVRTFFLARQ
jgi:haloacetate dehalogenase